MHLLLSLATALADIPPPPGYVETCTVEKQCGAGEEGVSCPAWHGEPDACAYLLAEGWALRCRTSGASAWSEVYCRSTGARERGGAAQALPGEGTGRAFASCGGPSSATLWTGLVVSLVFVVGLRRRATAEGSEVEEGPRKAA